MARYHFWQYLVNQEGQVIPNAQVSIYLAGTNIPAQVYLDEFADEIASELPQLETNSLGYFEFWVGDDYETPGYSRSQKFKVAWSKPRVASGQVDYVNIFPILPEVDEEDTNTEKNKTVSNFLANKWEAHRKINLKSFTSSTTGTSATAHGLYAVNPHDDDVYYNKTVSNELAKRWEDHRTDTTLDEHTQYLHRDGRRPMIGDLDMNMYSIENASSIDAGTAYLSGNADIDGWLQVQEDSTFESDLSITGQLDVGSIATLSSTLGVSGNGYFGSDLYVTGKQDVTGDSYLRSNLYLTGKQETSGTLGVSGNSYFGSNVDVSGTLNVNGETTLQSDTTITGTADISSNTTVGGTLDVTQGTNLSSTLIVSGQTDHYDDIDMNGNEIINLGSGNLNVYDEITKNTESRTLRGEPNGFIDPDNDANIHFDDGSLTFSISATDTYFDYYTDGVRYTKSGIDSITISNSEGMHYIYYDGDTLTSTTSFSEDIIIDKAFVAGIYWDSSNAKHIYLGSEYKHTTKMGGKAHAYLHSTRGYSLESGGGLGDFTTDSDGSLDAHAQFSNEASEAWDEDAYFYLSARAKTAILPAYYQVSDGDWRVEENDSFPVVNTGTGRAGYNYFNGSTWSLTEVSPSGFVLAHIALTNDENRPFVAFVGQEEYSTITDARLGSETEINELILNGMPTLEFKFVGTVIIQTDDSYTNTPKSRIVTTSEGADYLDLRGQVITRAGVSQTVTDHNTLANLQGGLLNQYYHLSQSEFNNLDGQDQRVKSTSSPTFADVSLTSPSNIYSNFDHGSIQGLGNDDHTQYLLADGTRTMSGDLDLGSNNITNVGTVNGETPGDATSIQGVDVSSIPPSADRQALVYDLAANEWKPGEGTEGGFGTPTVFSNGDIMYPDTLYMVDTTSQPLTGYLAPNVNDGDFISVLDEAGNFGTNSLTVIPSGAGETIVGSASYEFDQDNTFAVFLYSQDYSWRLDIGGFDVGAGIQVVATLPTWTAESEGTMIYVQDEEKVYYGSSTEWELVLAEPINIDLFPRDFSLDDTAVGSDGGSIFNMIECVDFIPGEDGAIWSFIEFEKNKRRYFSQDVGILLGYSLNGSDPGNVVEFETQYWTLTSSAAPTSASPDSSFTDTITAGSGNTGVLTQDVLDNGKVLSVDLESDTQYIILRFERKGSSDTYSGTFQLANIKLFQE